MDSGYDSEEEPPQDPNRRFMWRLDPVETLSDWKIEIVSQGVVAGESSDECLEDTTKVDTYHVHKNILSAGCRPSAYFKTLFNQDGFAEAQESTSRIELHSLAAKVFPDLLDYIYDGHTELKISTETATALHWLGQYFQLRHCSWEAKQFVQKDLMASNCGTYYEHAWLLENEKILEVAGNFCRENILEIGLTSRLLRVANNADFWIDLVENAQITAAFSVHMSELVCELSTNACINASDFWKLTERKYMPFVHYGSVVHFGSVLKLSALEEEFVSKCLRDRCVEAIFHYWRDGFIGRDTEKSSLSVLKRWTGMR